MEIKNYLEELGLNNNDVDVFLQLYSLGNQTASLISKTTGLERTTTYKILTKLHKLGIVSKTQKQGIGYFFVPSLDVIKNLIENKKKTVQKLESNFEEIKNSINEKYGKSNIILPKISIYDSLDGIKSIFRDIVSQIEKQNLLTIKFFGSNIFEEQKSNIKLYDYAEIFLNKIKNSNINIETYIANGGLIMEKINKSIGTENFINLSAGGGAINMFLVGSIVYIVIYNNIPIGIKIDNDKVSQAFHLIFNEIRN